MLGQFFALFAFIVTVIVILAVYAFKVGLHLQLIQIEKKKKPGRVVDLFFFDFADAKARKERMDAFMRYPLMFPVVIEEDDKEAVVELKNKIKRTNLSLYILLMLLIIVNALNA